ncbi:TAP domain protein [Kribbella flavida DSM 17836]|uniref:TAP domain protein n=1 Tax=Kribbella flavida (strain DSM 17836 / JCM 10339 / NBRC 14399) TaxID=479435 RepID=D2Q4R6_KRIFD|nr:alpha/beta hydrolase [Kribbella flavida]ADB34171.1 TAP domain protein [Kribbella flavida DSM 17836]
MIKNQKVAVALAALLVAPLLTTTTAAAAPQPTDPPTPSIPQKYLDQPIQWSVCSFDAQIKRLYPQAPTTNCAKVKVPMDWANPTAHPDIEVAISYSKATGTSRGLMASNPGGPGGAGLTLSAALATEKPQLFSDFDLLGFDPRGFGQSTPLQCITTAEELEALPVTPDYKERTKLTHRVEVAEAKLLADACSATEFGQFVSSQQTVYDMEFLRALFKSRQLSFIGYSYGTWLGGWYADAYPSKVGRFVLDSNMDWTHTQWQNVNFDPFSGQRRRDTQLFPWIARHADQITGLGSTPAQVKARYNGIRASLVTLVKAGESSVRGDDLDGKIYSTIYGNVRFIRATLDILVHDEFVKDPSASGAVELRHVDKAWARLSPELQAFDTLAAIRARYGVTAAAADTVAAVQVDSAKSVLADARQTAARATSGDQPVNLGAIGTTVRCNDTAWSHDPKFYLREADRMARKYDFFGYMNGVPMCAFWKYAPQDRKLDLKGSPRMLMVQAELDPATAYEGALRTHNDTLRATRFVAIDDEGQHGQYIGSASACAEAIGDRFVFTGELPGKDQVCGTSPLPAELSVFPVDGPVDGNAVRLPKSRANTGKTSPMLQQVRDIVAAGSLR